MSKIRQKNIYTKAFEVVIENQATGMKKGLNNQTSQLISQLVSRLSGTSFLWGFGQPTDQWLTDCNSTQFSLCQSLQVKAGFLDLYLMAMM